MGLATLAGWAYHLAPAAPACHQPDDINQDLIADIDALLRVTAASLE